MDVIRDLGIWWSKEGDDEKASRIFDVICKIMHRRYLWNTRKLMRSDIFNKTYEPA